MPSLYKIDIIYNKSVHTKLKFYNPTFRGIFWVIASIGENWWRENSWLHFFKAVLVDWWSKEYIHINAFCFIHINVTNEKGKCIINPKKRLFQDGRHFACCKGCWNHISRLCSLLTCHFLKMMSQALQLSIFLTLCCTFSLVICTSTPSPLSLCRALCSSSTLVWCGA